MGPVKRGMRLAGMILLKLLAYLFIFLIKVKHLVLVYLLRRPDGSIQRQMEKIRNSHSKVQELTAKRASRNSLSKILVNDLRNLVHYSTKKVPNTQKVVVRGTTYYFQPRPGLSEFLESIGELYDLWLYSDVDPELGNALVEASGVGRYCREEARLYKDWCTQGKKILNYINPDDSNILVLTSDLDELNDSSKECAIPIRPLELQLPRMTKILKHLHQMDGMCGGLHQDLESVRSLFAIELYHFQ